MEPEYPTAMLPAFKITGPSNLFLVAKSILSVLQPFIEVVLKLCSSVSSNKRRKLNGLLYKNAVLASAFQILLYLLRDGIAALG